LGQTRHCWECHKSLCPKEVVSHFCGGGFSVQIRSAVVCAWRNHIKFTIRYKARDTYRTEQRLTMYVVNVNASVGLVCRPEPGINICIDTGCKDCTDCQYESF